MSDKISETTRLFISYSHDSDEHKAWVLGLAERLVKNGVDCILDRWGLNFGSNLAHFMEQGITGATRVLAVCSEKYVEKANAGAGGVGYEKMILTGDLLKSIGSNRVIPLLRNNSSENSLPTFLTGQLYVDFREDDHFEPAYTKLIYTLHGEDIQPRPELGVNPFTVKPKRIDPKISFTPERFISPEFAGTVTFNYSNNNGKFVLGSGDRAFETKWSASSNRSIYIYNDPSGIQTAALVTGIEHITAIEDATQFDSSSRIRCPKIGEIVVWQNTSGFWLATKINTVKNRGHGDDVDEVNFSYVIAVNKSSNFSSLQSV